jgi:hypothetical protein
LSNRSLEQQHGAITKVVVIIYPSLPLGIVRYTSKHFFEVLVSIMFM